MPALSKAQRNLMALAAYNPRAVNRKNKGVLSMSKKQLGEFAATPTKGLPGYKNSMLAAMNGNQKVVKEIVKKRTGGK